MFRAVANLAAKASDLASRKLIQRLLYALLERTLCPFVHNLQQEQLNVGLSAGAIAESPIVARDPVMCAAKRHSGQAKLSCVT
jgi:hypothetical protein